MKYHRVAVLLGGLSREREVSLASGAAVAAGLRDAGYTVTEIDVTDDIDVQLRRIAPEAVFIALHGRFGEDGSIQGLLEMMKIPYTGSNIRSSALAIDKVSTCQLLRANGFATAPGYQVTTADAVSLPSGFEYPLVVKPSEEGSSVGVSIARDPASYRASLTAAFACSDRVLVEQFIPGREVQVAIFEDTVLGAVEIETHRDFYDYHAKYEPGSSVHHIPPRTSSAETERACAIAHQVYRAMGCNGAARVDLILPNTTPLAPIVLEINTIPGMTPTSLLPEIARHAGMSFSQLVSAIMETARLHI